MVDGIAYGNGGTSTSYNTPVNAHVHTKEARLAAEEKEDADDGNVP
jgi:hypothetical protein